MSDLTSELQRMADDAARHAQPLTAAEVIRQGDRRRRRSTTWQSLAGLSVAGVVTAGAVAAGAALVPGATGATGSGPAHHPGSGRLAYARQTAWTVSKLADGNISVTINQFKDPAGLQRTLRADGVPASVTFASQQNPACRPYPGGTLSPGSVPPRPLLPPPLLKQVFPQPYQQLGSMPRPGPARMVKAAGPPAPPPSGNRTVIVIDPSALPRNAGVQLASGNAAATALLLPQVVYASAQCTGS